MATLSRTIQSYGVLRPTEESLKSRSIRLLCDIIRNPSTVYKSFKSQPFESFYGYLTVVRNGYIVREIPIKFEHQELWNADELTELLNYERYWACRFQSGINYLKNLVSPSTPDFTLADTGVFKSLRPNVDEFRVKLLTEDVIAKLTLQWEPLFTCLDDPTQQDDPPPPTPPVKPPDTNDPLPSSDNSPESGVNNPYDGTSDDGRSFAPPPPPDPGSSGTRYNVVVYWEINSPGIENGRTSNAIVWGAVGGARGYFDGTVSHLQVLCYGLAPSADSTQLSTQTWVDILETSPIPTRFNSVRINSSTPI